MGGLSELITRQAETLAVMFCGGVFTESLWQARKLLQLKTGSRFLRAVGEIGFWISSAAVISAFLYYCAFGKISFHALLGFWAGLLLWKKICCVIIRPWVKDDAAKNSKITARSSIWSRPGRKGWKREERRGSGKRRRLRKLPDARREEKWLSEEAATDGD